MKQLFTRYKNKIKKIINDLSFEDLLDKSKKYTIKAKDKVKTKLIDFGADEYFYKAQEYFNKAQDKIEKSFKQSLLMNHF